MNILFISRWFPYPPNNGSKLRIYNLLRGLARQHTITLLSFVDEPGIDQNSHEIRSLCKNIYTVPWIAYNANSTRARIGFFSRVPRSIKDTFSQAMASQIQHLIQAEKYDCVIASQADAASYRRCFNQLPAVFEEVECGVLYEGYTRSAGLSKRIRTGLTWAKQRHYLASLIQEFSVCTVVSEKEKRLLNKMLPEYQAVHVIPNCIDLADYDPILCQPDPGSIIFTGSFKYFPNYEAMNWFIGETFPRIHVQVPGVKLVITGDHANKPLPYKDNIILTGFVDNVRPLIANSWVSIAPIFQGGGTRLKILEAMALKTPVVATAKGAEGLNVVDGKHILIADSADDFANAVIMLLSNLQLRQMLADNAYRLVKQEYDWSVIMPEFMNLVQKVALRHNIP